MQAFLDWILGVTRKIPFLNRIIQLLLNKVDVKDVLWTLHYGCPNSKRTAKLQMKKRIFK